MHTWFTVGRNSFPETLNYFLHIFYTLIRKIPGVKQSYFNVKSKNFQGFRKNAF